MLRGFVLEWTDELTLVNVVADEMDLDGYSVIRNKDIRRWRPLDRKSFIGRALKLKELAPVSPDGLSLGTWPDVLESAGKIFPLLTIHREKINPRVCYIGRVSSLTEKVVTLRKIDPDARWGDTKRYRLCDLTKIDFGGRYEEALALVAADNRRRRK